MILEIYFCKLIYILIVSLYSFFLLKKYNMCPELLWCISQSLMFVGITLIIDNNNPYDVELLYMYLLGMTSFICISLYTLQYKTASKHIELCSNQYAYKKRKILLWSIMIVSIFLCSLFFVIGGGIVFLNGVKAMLLGGDYSVKYARMGLLSVPGVGYIYQFRVTILPICVLYYAMVKGKCLTTYILSIIMITFLIGTGQRGGLVSFICILMLTIYYWSKNNKISLGSVKRKYFGILCLTLGLFAISTFLNGRSGESGSVIAAIVQRFVSDNQTCAVVGFRMIKNMDIQFGYEWYKSFGVILHIDRDFVPLATRIFADIYGGSYAGTAPECIWGSAYHNFSIPGVVFIGSILGYFTTSLHCVYSKKKCDSFDIIVYSALQFLMAFWVAGGPVNLINNGFVSVLILRYLLNNGVPMRFKY